MKTFVIFITLLTSSTASAFDYNAFQTGIDTFYRNMRIQQDIQNARSLQGMNYSLDRISDSMERQSTFGYRGVPQYQTCRSVYDCPSPETCENRNGDGQGVCLLTQ